MATTFTAADFIATKWSSGEDKARFANQFVALAQGGFKPTLFPKTFYYRLSDCFHHIAHNNREGFYGTWLSTDAQRAEFLANTQRDVFGDPTFTFADVERALQTWVRESGLQQVYEERASKAREASERQLLAQLKAKWEGR